jgi:hypothetical protein
MIVNHLKPEDVGPLIRKQMRAMDTAGRKELNRKVIGPTMVTMVIVAFATGTGPDDKPWRSKAAETKLGGRFSKRYNKRPSGATVDASSIRNLDKGALANTHRVLHAGPILVCVGPGKGKHDTARSIMEREATYGNFAVGWDKARIRIVQAELQAFFDEVAQGKTPRYLPRSRIQRRV